MSNKEPSDVQLILASASPRRAELLGEHGYRFVVVAPPLPEPTEFPSPMTPVQQAEYLSHFKAKSVANLLSSATRGALADTELRTALSAVRSGQAVAVLGADTIAAVGDRVFGKPADRADAKRILSTIARTVHHVITGLTLIDARTGHSVTRHDITAVHMRPLSNAELEAYLDTGAWEGKAGAYGIQDHGDAFVTRIEGSFTNVVGLPMELLATMLTA